MTWSPTRLRIFSLVSLLSMTSLALGGCAAELADDGSMAGAGDPSLAPGEAPGWPAPTPAPDVDGGAGAPQPTPGEPAAPPSDPSASPSPSLGALPPELAELAWPERPRTSREVTVTTAAELSAEAAVPGTRIHVQGASGGDVSVTASDVEIEADEATTLGTLSIAQSVARVRVTGGRWGGVRVAIPAVFAPSVEYRPEWMAEDLWFQNVTVDSGSETALEIRGRRIALLESDVTGGRYSVWCGDTAHFQSEDVILFGNTLRSAGPEATVRLVSVLRSAVVANQLSNTYKHNYRIHGTSDLNYAADNLLAGTGVMLGTMEGDSLGRVWFDDNEMHHDAPDLFNPSPTTIRELYARRNVVHAAQHGTLYGGAVPSGWTLEDNVVGPYTPAPPF